MSSFQLNVVEAGRLEYGAALDLQLHFTKKVREKPRQAYLLLLEHEPVFTLGKNGKETNVLHAGDIPVVRTDRGGDVTYHGPGQLVGYPILDLREMGLGVKSYVRRVETTLIATLSELGVTADTKPKCVGVWCGAEKIAALGFRVERGITRHGFALNVNNSAEPFSRIHPCGMPGCEVTSIRKEQSLHVTVEDAARHVVPHFQSAFGFRVVRRVPTPVPAL